MKTVQKIVNVSMALLLCLQLFNACVYIPSWMYPGPSKADLTESVVELLLEAMFDDSNLMSDCQIQDTPDFPNLSEEEMMEDLDVTDDHSIDFALFAFSQVQHNYYHYTTDIKTHVRSVVPPPPDFC